MSKRIFWAEVAEGQTSGVVEVPDVAPCGCRHGAPVPAEAAPLALVHPKLAWMKKTEALRVGEEPLFGIADGGRVAGCGASGCDGAAGTPAYFAFDSYSVGEGGAERTETIESALPKELVEAYAKKERGTCLPWVRVENSPKRFRACLDALRKIGPIDSARKVNQVVGEYLRRQEQETFIVLSLDAGTRGRGVSEIARGGRSTAPVPVPDTLRIGLILGASSIIVCHNHPSGVALPSPEDIQVTRALAKASRAVGVPLLDHVIIGGGNTYYSFMESDPTALDAR